MLLALIPRKTNKLALALKQLFWLTSRLSVSLSILLGPISSAQDPYTAVPIDSPQLVIGEVGTQTSADEILERLKAAEEKIAELSAADKPAEKKEEKKEEKPKGWFEKYKLGGYTQIRMNETLDEAPGSALAQHVGDSSVGRNNEIFIRRARLTLEGDVTDRIYIYFQPEFAGTVPNSPDNVHYVQIRDWYADLHFDDAKEYRVRLGQSKVPFGWENLQSSRNRLPLDRNDAFNSGTKNERDLGAFFYWTPEYAQDFFKTATDENLKGSGNYGVLGFGFYNGQGGSLKEQNDNLHFASRLTIPYTFCNGQMTEFGVQGYHGKYTVLSQPISPLGVGPTARPLGTLEQGNVPGILDQRIGTSWIYYPQPLGLQAEWNVGRGPALNDAQTEVVDRPLYGGYVMALYRYQSQCHGEFWPFVRWGSYKGGYKSEFNAPFAEISELELGCEWQATKHLEFVTTYTWTERTNTRALNSANTLSYQQFDGDLLRLQVQIRY
jgi:hypothetical protein